MKQNNTKEKNLNSLERRESCTTLKWVDWLKEISVEEEHTPGVIDLASAALMLTLPERQRACEIKNTHAHAPTQAHILSKKKIT